MSDQDTYIYNFRKGRKIVKTGITMNIERREKEHQTERGKCRSATVPGRSAIKWADGQRIG